MVNQMTEQSNCENFEQPKFAHNSSAKFRRLFLYLESILLNFPASASVSRLVSIYKSSTENSSSLTSRHYYHKGKFIGN